MTIHLYRGQRIEESRRVRVTRSISQKSWTISDADSGLPLGWADEVILRYAVLKSIGNRSVVEGIVGRNDTAPHQYWKRVSYQRGFGEWRDDARRGVYSGQYVIMAKSGRCYVNLAPPISGSA